MKGKLNIKTLTQNGDVVHLIKNFLPLKECSRWVENIPSPKLDPRFKAWQDRVTTITEYPIVKHLSQFLEASFKIPLKIQEAQTQIWQEQSSSPLHNHFDQGRGATRYNSLIYLNNNYEGGEFYTQGGIRLKPEVGMLTFFDGQKIHHGVSPITKGHRFTLIFYWKE